MRHLRLPSGGELPVLGQGTWGMGEDPSAHAAEVTALRHGLDLGTGLIDTAEMYGSGGAERVVGAAIEGRRDEVFLVSKVLPHHADRAGTVRACEQSLRRLGTDRIDLYLLHWRGGVPLEQTLEAFTELWESGKIGEFGVSNLDTDDMRELRSLAGGEACATDQVLYNLSRRGPEYELLPWCRDHGIPVMAYSPIEQGRLLDDPVLRRVAEDHGASPARVAVAWVLAGGGLCAIPKATKLAHVEENRAALDLRLTEEDLRVLNERFPPPEGRTPLELL
ncbi:oxidoreductase [Nocardiopsis terrae]|uniref:Diketogulonate reductase-like aldo/keto reductase n=1 Tax=Nocardiopsis terrae TaxID=372655 RepID=A0ABR9HA93_9ACTN|nr:aldo/keto reductase [Nocardiopsis terrae]MBE1455928.1 diketogulonate reductase-like aldo/keto reductase [Nocardiopsis terrae]GHC96651.1 oxidoreductase [Nocardiopsis terrae]